MSPPVVFAVPAEADLAPSPICPDWIIDGAPQARAKRLAESADGTSCVVAWSCTAGRFKWHYGVDETLHIISGEVFVTNENNEVRRLGPGDVAFFPAGSRSVWHVTKKVRKLAVCWHAMPRPLGFALRVWNGVINRLTGFSVGVAGLAETPPPTCRSHQSHGRLSLSEPSLTTRRGILNQPGKRSGCPL